MTGSDGLLLDAPDEWWCAWSMKHRGRAAVPPVLPSFLLGVAAGWSFLMFAFTASY